MNVIDYLKWRGDLSLAVSPFNEVDNLVLAQLSFVDWKGIVPTPGHGRIALNKAAGLYFAAHPQLPEAKENFLNLTDYYRMTRLMADSVRFGKAELMAYSYDFDPAIEKQFAALTVCLSDGTAYVSFRGTDNSIVGWKEDFNFAIMCPTPSQQSAADYLGWVKANTIRRLRVGGHSKGGNLAMYAGALAYDRYRIMDIFNNDGPGFTPAFVKTKAFSDIKPVLKIYNPQSSVVGMLMINDAPRTFVLSDAKQIIDQHNGYSWQLVGTRFERAATNSEESKEIKKITNDWVYNISTEDKMIFFNTIYDIIDNAGLKTLDDVGVNMIRMAPQVIESFNKFSAGQRELFTQIIALVFKISGYDIKKALNSAPLAQRIAK